MLDARKILVTTLSNEETGMFVIALGVSLAMTVNSNDEV